MATGTVILNCARIEDPGVAAVDHLARLTLGLRRGGCKTCLANPNAVLMELIDLVGLAEVLGVRPETLGEKFGDPGGPDSGKAPSSGASASVDA